MFLTCLQKGKSGIFTIVPSNIRKVVKSFSVEQTTADHKFINNLMEETGTKLDDFVKVKEDGQSLLYELLQKNFITCCLPIKYSKKLINSLTNAEQNSILLNENYKSFIKTLNKSINFIKGE